MRETIHRRAPWSEDSARGLIAELGRLRSEGHCPAKLLDKAVTGGFRNLYPGPDTRADRPIASAKPYQPRTADELRRAIAVGEGLGWDVSAHREALERLESTGPPGPVNVLLRQSARAATG